VTTTKLPRQWVDIKHERGIIQARIVIPIALLALARKVVVADLYEAAPGTLVAFAALALSFGVTYWLIRDSDTEPPRQEQRAPKPGGT
jgi:uncharacterized membrane protein (DUF373 family)